ncbi:MAG: DUF2293 domain-containing protein [Anaerolineaceae bacterium]|nr:DUF2293 domain-containing protein [Anaerolineaceae bacterium]MCB9099021.1 DUF2293 domain-containing protein [Anaerolineales bacterium]
MAKNNEISVFIASQDATCDECGEALGHDAWITLTEDNKALCLACADLEHLIFLPAGDAALTRRSRKHSTLSAVVLKWNKRRKRYERQGLLVESQALEQAEEECLADSEVRERRRAREAVRRVELDRQYVEAFAGRVRQLFPGCPAGRETIIAEHACLKYSGRVGRSAAAKTLDDQAIRLAVIAHIRHVETQYDSLLAGGYGRRQARQAVEADIDRVLTRWQS